MRAVVLGGGGFRVPLIGRALRAARLGIDELILYDISPDRLRTILLVLEQAGAGDSQAIAVRATGDLDDALRGADLVFSAMRVGGLDGRVHDERLALELGLIGQETVGAGGLASALRTVPEAVRIAHRIAELAPAAWVITMTNPAGIVTEAMSPVLGDRVIGVCDSASGLVARASRALGADPDTTEVDYVGLNHLGWLRELRVDGHDSLPGLLDDPAALASIEEGRLFGQPFLQALGALPNEYLYYFYDARTALHSIRAAAQTRGEHVREEQRAFYAAASARPHQAGALWQQANDERNSSYFAELRGTDQTRDVEDIAGGGYEGIAAAAARALTGGPPARLILNVPNRGTVPGLPADAVVEVGCRVDTSGARPLPVGPPSEHQLGLMSSVKASERAIIEAALTGSRSALLRAFAVHPLVGSLASASRLAEDALGS
ncbi:MAG: 6-phospho-beta-glucosidase [Jatrophihabitans sp.]